MPIRCRSMTGLGSVNEGETVKPAADPRARERQADDAALDELRKAFGVPPDTPAPAAPIQVSDDAPTQSALEAPAPAAPPADPPKPAEPPRIVRIDDYAASLAEPPRSAGAPGPPVDPLIAHPPKPSPPEPRVIAIQADDLPDAD